MLASKHTCSDIERQDRLEKLAKKLNVEDAVQVIPETLRPSVFADYLEARYPTNKSGAVVRSCRIVLEMPRLLKEAGLEGAVAIRPGMIEPFQDPKWPESEV
jgi:hypothetical protein